MANYTKATNFSSKDSLLTGNPSKLVRGTEIDIEFNNIATAVATKADINSPTFIGTPAAPTASAGTNTTQIATTAFVTANFPTTNIAFTGDNTHAGMETFRDNKFEITDNSDTTKKVNFEVSGLSTATTRTLTVPNKSGTLSLTSDLDAVSALSATSNSIVTGSYSATGSSTITVTTPTANTFAVGQEVFITFTRSGGTGDILVANKFTIVSIISSTQFTISYGSTVTSSGDVTVERYGLMAVANAAEMTAGTSQLKAVTPKQFRDFSLVRATVQNTTATTVTFSDIPSWVKKITVMLQSVSGGPGNSYIRLGTSGGVVSIGYNGAHAEITDTPNRSSPTSGIYLGNIGASIRGGIATITNISGNTWVYTYHGSDGSTPHIDNGSIALSGTLTQLQLAFSSAPSSGTANIIYE